MTVAVVVTLTVVTMAVVVVMVMVVTCAAPYSSEPSFHLDLFSTQPISTALTSASQ